MYITDEMPEQVVRNQTYVHYSLFKCEVIKTPVKKWAKASQTMHNEDIKMTLHSQICSFLQLEK